MPALVLVQERVLLKSLNLDENEYLIGRGDDCDFVLDGKEISRKHARVRYAEEKYVVEDLGSTNGTFVNGKRISFQALSHGDEISIGEFTVVFDDGHGIEGICDETHVEKAGEETKSLVAHYKSVTSKVRERATAKELKKYHEQVLKGRKELKKLANQDRLTRVFNRRFFDGKITELMAQSKEDGTPLSLIFVDLDHFKAVNDTYGHAKGDEVLKTIAQLILAVCRQSDIVARYGGEEFVVLFAKMTSSNVVDAAESIRKIIDERSKGMLGIQVTVSIGVATYPDQAPDEKSLMHKADQALYQAKASGRNRVIKSNG